MGADPCLYVMDMRAYAGKRDMQGAQKNRHGLEETASCGDRLLWLKRRAGKRSALASVWHLAQTNESCEDQQSVFAHRWIASRQVAGNEGLGSHSQGICKQR